MLGEHDELTIRGAGGEDSECILVGTPSGGENGRSEVRGWFEKIDLFSKISAEDIVGVCWDVVVVSVSSGEENGG